MWKTLKNAWQIEDVRKRILYTVLMILIMRIGANIPVPGTDSSVVKNILGASTMDSFNILTMFTGTSLESFSILALSISPYITASIIMELLTIAIPPLEELAREGNDGRKKIAKYTRYATVALALIEAIAMTIGFGNQGLFGTFDRVFYSIICVITLTAGSAFLMWVGENITENGIGNGISIVLLVNILSGVPSEISAVWTVFTSGKQIAVIVVIAIAMVAFVLALVAFVVWLNGGSRKIPVQYSGKMNGRRTLGGGSSNIPLKVMTASVIPVIFASSILSIPQMIIQFTGATVDYTTFWGKVLLFLSSNSWFNPSIGWIYTLGFLVYVILVFVFAYFYTYITFNPVEIADNLKKQSGFIPGLRPGRPTSDYLTSVLNSIIFIGACGLSIVAMIPVVVGGLSNVGHISFLGTSLIIIVGVILETLQQVEGRMVSREYDSIF